VKYHPPAETESFSTIEPRWQTSADNADSTCERLNQPASTPHSRFIVEMYVHHIESLLGRLGRAFPDKYQPEKKILKENIDWMHGTLAT
jgi:hypothetical protein